MSSDGSSWLERQKRELRLMGSKAIVVHQIDVPDGALFVAADYLVEAMVKERSKPWRITGLTKIVEGSDGTKRSEPLTPEELAVLGWIWNDAGLSLPIGETMKAWEQEYLPALLASPRRPPWHVAVAFPAQQYRDEQRDLRDSFTRQIATLQAYDESRAPVSHGVGVLVRVKDAARLLGPLGFKVGPYDHTADDSVSGYSAARGLTVQIEAPVDGKADAALSQALPSEPAEKRATLLEWFRGFGGKRLKEGGKKGTRGALARLVEKTGIDKDTLGAMLDKAIDEKRVVDAWGQLQRTAKH